MILCLLHLDEVANVLDQPEPTFSIWRIFLQARVDTGKMLVDHFSVRAGSLEVAVPRFKQGYSFLSWGEKSYKNHFPMLAILFVMTAQLNTGYNLETGM